LLAPGGEIIQIDHPKKNLVPFGYPIQDSLMNYLIDTSLTQIDKAGLSTLIGSNPNDNIQNTTMAAVGAGFAVCDAPQLGRAF